MGLLNVKVATKLWVTLLGLLVVLSVANLWGQSAAIASLEKARADVQRIEDKVTAAEQMKGLGLRLVDVGVSLIAVSNAENRNRLQEMFTQRAQRVNQAMQVLQSQLESEEDRQAFAAIIRSSEATRVLREQADQTIASDDFQARREFAYGAYAAGGVQYEAAIDAFIQLQKQQVQAWLEIANTERDRTRGMAWVVTVVLLLLGVFLARWLVQTITQPLQRAVEMSERIGAGDLTVHVHTERKDEFGHLLNALDGMASRLRTVVQDVRASVNEVSSASSEIAKGNLDLSARTEQTAANLEQTAASIEELTATVNQSADISRQANQLASTAVQAAERGGEVVNQVVESMEHINTSSRKISDIIGVIDGIAFQTNILALNAAVEAARAGEQGRGFAVVAGEVRNLAGRSAEAAKEIKGLIEASVRNVDAGAQQVHQAGASMQDIVASVRRVTDLIGEISSAAHEQREGFAQVNQAVSNLDQMTQQNAALVEESTAAANAMHDQAQRLTHTVAIFKVGQEAAAPVAVSTRVEPALATQPVPASAKPAVRTAASAKVATAPQAQSALAASALATPKPKPKHKPKPKPAPQNTAHSDDDWETF